MNCSALTAHSFLGIDAFSHCAMFSRRNTAIVESMPVGKGSVATNTSGMVMCTNVSTHVVSFIIRTLFIIVTCYMSLGISFVGWAVWRTGTVTWLSSWYRPPCAANWIVWCSRDSCKISAAAVLRLHAAVLGTVLAQPFVAAETGFLVLCA